MTTAYKTYKWFNPRPSTISEGQAMYRDLATTMHEDRNTAMQAAQEIPETYQPTAAIIF